MSKLQEVINSYGNDELIYASELLKDFPALYRDLKKCDVIKVKKGIYIKNIVQTNPITNTNIAIYDNENIKNKLIIEKNKEKLVPTDITLLNSLNLTTQVPYTKTYIVVNNIKINNIKGYKLEYNRKNYSREILLIDSFLKAIYTNIELENNNFQNFIFNNKVLFDKYIKEIKLNSNKYTYLLYYIYRNLYNDELLSKKIKKNLNISSKFQLPLIIKENYGIKNNNNCFITPNI